MPEPYPKPRRQVRERVQMKRRRMRAPKLTAKRQEQREQRAAWAVAVKARDPLCRAFTQLVMNRLTQAAACRRRTADAHHLLAKSQGGTDELWNGRGLCHPCHMWVHAHREEAQALGLLAHVGDCSELPEEGGE